MGSLLSRSQNDVDIFIDFENAAPTSAEQKLYAECDQLLAESKDMMNRIQNYHDCKASTTRAMQTNNPSDQRVAFENLLICVDSINHFYNFTTRLEPQVVSVLNTLARAPEEDQKLSDSQALGKQFGAIVNFCLMFDFYRMTCNVGNDLAFYRRFLPKFPDHPDIIVGEDEAGDLNMFNAMHNPMMHTLIKACTEVADHNTFAGPTLAAIANSCFKMLRAKTFTNAETTLFVARAMTGCIVVFDHLPGLGAFHKRSPILMKQLIGLLKKDFADHPFLLDALRYSTRTFRDAPVSLKTLLE